MNLLLKTAALIVLPLTLSACIYVDGRAHHGDWREEQNKNLNIINQLELGSDRQSALDKLGTPNFSEAFSNDKGTFHVLYYRTQHRHSDGETSTDETTPLVFKDGKLLGWGQSVLLSLER